MGGCIFIRIYVFFLVYGKGLEKCLVMSIREKKNVVLGRLNIVWFFISGNWKWDVVLEMFFESFILDEKRIVFF